jgi:hypothetical protein
VLFGELKKQFLYLDSLGNFLKYLDFFSLGLNILFL